MNDDRELRARIVIYGFMSAGVPEVPRVLVAIGLGDYGAGSRRRSRA
jgi:hypothetical protein